MPKIIKWKIIPGFPNYAVSDLGLVKRVNINVHGIKGYLLKQSIVDGGYASVCLYRRGKSLTVLVSHLVLLTFVGKCPDGKECCHNNGVRLDNRLSNLRWDSHSSNVLDAVRHGTHVPTQGSKNGKSKLLEDEALELFDKFHSGDYTVKELASEYGLHPEYVRLVGKGKYWRHLYAVII